MDKIKIIGQKNGSQIEIEVSKIMLGASDYLRKDNIVEAEKIINQYKQLGGNCFDTAHHYRHSDEAISEYFKRNKNRDDFIIFAKGGHPVREYPHIPRVNRNEIINDVESSLRKLNVEYLDLFALHRDDEKVDVSEIMNTLHELVIAGKIHAIGTSNWNTDRIKLANDYAQQNNLTQFTFNSPNLSLAKPIKQRWPDCISANDEMIKYHIENNIPLISWSAQASGFLSGAFTPNDRSNSEIVESFYSEKNWQRFEVAKKYAIKYNTTPITISLAWVLSQKFPTVAIIGPENIEQLNESLESLQINLNPRECDELDLKIINNIDHKIALQLYSVRKELEKDMPGTLAKVAKMGYKYVQMDGLRGNDIWEFRNELVKNDLKVVGMHIKHERFFNDIQGIMNECVIFECKNIFDKYIDEEDQNEEGYKKTRAQLHRAYDLLQNKVHIGLHNPEYDFNKKVNGLNCLDYICACEDGKYVYPELDTYWLHVAGHNIVDYMQRYTGKIELIHCKDISLEYDLHDLQNNIVPCGQGIINFKEVIKTGEKCGVKYYVIEQDCSVKEDIMKCVEQSLDYIKTIGREIFND